jgi:hypothetical protein
MTIVQTFLYFRLYPKDPSRIKLMVRGSLAPIYSRLCSDACSSQVIGIWFVLARLWAPLITMWSDSNRLLDSTHAALMCASTWEYLIVNFGNEEIADRIPM